MKGLNVSIPFLVLALARTSSPSDDPSPAPDIAATVESAVARRGTPWVPPTA